MFTTKHFAVDTKGQKRDANPSSFSHELESRHLTRMSSFNYPLSIEESQERQFDIIEEQGMQSVTRLTPQDTNTDVNDHQQKDILDSSSSDSTNLSSFRCILNEEDPDLNNPNLYNCKTCRKGFIHNRSRKLFPEADHCDEHSLKNNQSSGDFEKNTQNHERYQLQTQKASLASNIAQPIFSTVEHLPIDSTSVEFDDQQKSPAYHLQDGFSGINLAEENNIRSGSSVQQEGYLNIAISNKRKMNAKCPYKCEQCPKRFLSKNSFKNHALVHGAQPRFICDFCSKGFMIGSRLRRHLIVHGNDIDSRYPFKCNKCWRRFSSESGIEGHDMRVHGAQAKFICKLCQKRFMYKSHFEIHSRTHKTDVEAKFPFKCNQCSKRFSSKANVARHTMLDHGAQAKFICDLCSKGFMAKCHLRAHWKVHIINVR